MASFQPHPSSYRDPSGFVFYKDDSLYRQVNAVYKDDFLKLMDSGLFDALVSQGKLLAATQLNQNLTGSEDWYCTLQPEPLPFISYPYEWSFAMLKDAALLTLDIMEQAMEKGMILKDATPYNVQLHKGKMIFIDTLSFERYDETKPWIAYKQFCETFLLPLALMHYTRQPLQSLLLAYPDGIPLSLGRSLLPLRSKWNLNAYLHLHLNATVINKTSDPAKKQVPFSAKKLGSILASLKQAVLSYRFTGSGVWTDYYNEATQRDDYVAQKTTIIQQWLNELPNVATAIDIGANEGLFSEVLAARKITTIAADFDHASINRLYEKSKVSGASIYPIVIDFANPSPAIGLNNRERLSLFDRVQSDLVLALAVVHHLAIGKNIPFTSIAELFLQLGKTLIVEFVPRDDEKVQLMLTQKKDIYQHYTEADFVQAFAGSYTILKEFAVGHSGRKLFLMKPHEE